MKCHNCPHSKKVESGAFKNMAFADMPCAACELSEFPEPAIPLNDEVLLQPAAAAPEEPEHSAFDAIAHIITTILLMPPVLRDVICWRYAGFKYQDIALLQNCTAAAVEARHRRAFNQWPELKALFALKMAKQKRRLH
jgi:DNA-directed RNA polymerase specialized sigma24 family protein